MNRITHLILVVVTMIVSSCERYEENIQLPSSVMGEWEITAYLENMPIYESFPLIIYANSSSKIDSITLRDAADYFWNFQVKAAVNHENETFQTRGSVCELSKYKIGIKILNGKIIESDSIYFEIQFEDDETPYGNTYQLRGNRVN